MTMTMIKVMMITMLTYKSRPCHSGEGLKCRDPLRQGSKHQLEELGCSWQTLLNVGYFLVFFIEQQAPIRGTVLFVVGPSNNGYFCCCCCCYCYFNLYCYWQGCKHQLEELCCSWQTLAILVIDGFLYCFFHFHCYWQGCKHQFQELSCSWQALVKIGYFCFFVIVIVL